ncbi:hypothetical protein E2C01_032487 [Portunus trituberculatus]|uniref:Uncharacterized protein n=1 Tax=Portunus trituberculatus TaxID=210409 RepID=A0A5B7F127_PORTR|nr:hypothetical protein [Portunus trituberculatus]
MRESCQALRFVVMMTCDDFLASPSRCASFRLPQNLPCPRDTLRHVHSIPQPLTEMSLTASEGTELESRVFLSRIYRNTTLRQNQAGRGCPARPVTGDRVGDGVPSSPIQSS